MFVPVWIPCRRSEATASVQARSSRARTARQLCHVAVRMGDFILWQRGDPVRQESIVPVLFVHIVFECILDVDLIQDNTQVRIYAKGIEVGVRRGRARST